MGLTFAHSLASVYICGSVLGAGILMRPSGYVAGPPVFIIDIILTEATSLQTFKNVKARFCCLELFLGPFHELLMYTCND